MRIDQLLVQRGLASTRSQAQRLIADGVEWRVADTWRRVAKNGDDVSTDAELRLLNDAEARYVSRGGLKLEFALQQVGLSVDGCACLDIGQSTGGFTDCLLQHGAATVVGVDVGSAQLHPALRSDPRVLCVEKVNARALTVEDIHAAYESSMGADGPFEADSEDDGEAEAEDDIQPTALRLGGADGHEDFDFGDGDIDEADEEFVHEDADFDADAEPVDSAAQAFEASEFSTTFDVLVADLSFISQTLVLPAVVPMLKPGGTLLTLVKPQFELQPGQVGKGGIVRDPEMYALVEARLRQSCADLGLTVTHWFDSPIAGGDGNHEFFICAKKPL